jgi:hypothetical protein
MQPTNRRLNAKALRQDINVDSRHERIADVGKSPSSKPMMHPLRSRRLADRIQFVCRQPRDHGFGSAHILQNARAIQQREPPHTALAGVATDPCRLLLPKDLEPVREVPLSKQDLLSSATKSCEGNPPPNLGGIYFLQSSQSSSQWSQLSHCGFGSREK